MLSKKCLNCSELFYKKASSSRLNWETKIKFCSRICFHDYKQVQIECSICKTMFRAKRSHKDLLKTCSVRCRKLLRSVNSKKLSEEIGAPIHRGNAKENMTVAIRKKHRDGDVGYMKKTWRGNKNRMMGESNPRWKPVGSKRDDGHGYIMIKIAEGKGSKNWIQEHVDVMEKKLGRKINLEKDCVHHIDGDKKNNDINNLQLMTHTEHKSLHMKLRYSQ